MSERVKGGMIAALVVALLLSRSDLASQAITSPTQVDLRRGTTISFSSISVAASGDNTIVAADASNKIKVLAYVIVADGTVNVTWKSGAATSLSGAMALVANTGAVAPATSPGGSWYLETAVNQALVLNLSAAIGVRGHLTYFKEP